MGFFSSHSFCIILGEGGKMVIISSMLASLFPQIRSACFIGDSSELNFPGDGFGGVKVGCVFIVFVSISVGWLSTRINPTNHNTTRQTRQHK